jgi:hypothetical protein
MVQTKTRAKPAKRKNIKIKKAKAQKRKGAMKPMSRKEHEKMGRIEEPMMAASMPTMHSQRQSEQEQNQWGGNPSNPTRQGNSQNQWTERVAEGQRNLEPAPGTNEFEPEKE